MIEQMYGFVLLFSLALAGCHSLDRPRPVPVNADNGPADALVEKRADSTVADLDAVADLSTCDSSQPDSCAAGLDCVAGVCRCIQGGRCKGCCASDAFCIATPSAGQCGHDGGRCTKCGDGLADGCRDGACSCGDEQACTAPARCVDQACKCTKCCPAGMTWNSELQLCYSGPHGPADWNTAADDCRSRGGCIGAPDELGLGLCGTWLTHTSLYAYSCFSTPDEGVVTESCAGSDSLATCSACPASIGCVQRYYCFSASLLPVQQPCGQNSHCGRDQHCSVSGDCIPLTNPYCCQSHECTWGCERGISATGRCQ